MSVTIAYEDIFHKEAKKIKTTVKNYFTSIFRRARAQLDGLGIIFWFHVVWLILRKPLVLSKN